MRGLFTLLYIVTSASACDPVMYFSIPGAKTVRAGADGGRYVLAIGDGIEARFHASVFTIHGHTEVQVVNNSEAAIEFAPTPTLLVAANGSRVPAQCELPGPQKVSIPKGQAVTVVCGFEARLRGFSYEPEFKALTVTQPGFSKGGKPLEIVARMSGS